MLGRESDAPAHIEHAVGSSWYIRVRRVRPGRPPSVGGFSIVCSHFMIVWTRFAGAGAYITDVSHDQLAPT
jgi:hypothetical protein